MGLDMYLKASRGTYISEYEGSPDYPQPRLSDIDIALRSISVPSAFEQFGGRDFSCTAIYWRKANAIHKWFVDNVQEGEDDCGTYYVSIDTLEKLLNTLRDVLDDPTRAEELLPTQSGCFFGTTEYDIAYMDDVRRTIDKRNAILNMPEKELCQWWFEYKSSW
jgi:hypothetical protein